MAPKSAQKEKKEEEAKASPAKASPASAAKTRAGSPGKEKTPAKKQKSESAEVPAAAEGPAAHTRAKEGDLPASAAAKASAAVAALNMLPPISITDVLLGDHRDTVALLKHFEETGSKELSETVKEVLDAFVAHMKEEEELLPQMLQTMSDEEQVDLAQSFLAAKAKAPLEPQPEAAEALA